MRKSLQLIFNKIEWSLFGLGNSEVYLIIDGCPIVNNVCVDSLIVKNYWGLLTGDYWAQVS